MERGYMNECAKQIFLDDHVLNVDFDCRTIFCILLDDHVFRDMPSENLDLTEQFTTDLRYREKCGCIVVIKKSDYAHSGRTPRLLFACERYGIYRPKKKVNENQEEEKIADENCGEKKKQRKRKTSTKRCDCPFLLKGIHLSGPEDRWKVSVDCGRHNHSLATYLEGHSYAGRLTNAERQVSFEMTKNGVRPSQILNVIKERDPNNKSTKQQIYNHRAKLRRCTTTGRVESAHAKLKRYMGYMSTSDFVGLWQSMHLMITEQLTEIYASFERRLNNVRHDFRLLTLVELRGFVSKDAMEMIFKERKHGGLGGMATEEFHYFWKKLSRVPTPRVNDDVDLHPEISNIMKRFEDGDDSYKQYLLKKLKEITHPNTSCLVEPKEKTKTRGTPEIALSGSVSLIVTSQCASKKQKLKVTRAKTASSVELISSIPNMTHAMEILSAFPIEVKGLIADINNVSSDGNCGFRAVALALGMGHGNWKQVRDDLCLELAANKSFYTSILGDEVKYKNVYDRIHCDKSPCGEENWMSMLDCGPLIASCYNVVVVHLSPQARYTCLPLKSSPPSKSSLRVIAVALVNNCHFMHALLKLDCPLPLPIASWKQGVQASARAWRTIFEARFEAFEAMVQRNTTSVVLD
ncbi:hypothetical protein IFM89_003468 [Coptis chinensis]|uniref:Protein FAR1-RELATED SEQUENCE n=1 Tax=Coptis chinensis TaxID=261450 RepID=A0A835H9E7_9MAGN|nr:hypothetical protein IFM89_003468 [Coptis chinensis]